MTKGRGQPSERRPRRTPPPTPGLARPDDALFDTPALFPRSIDVIGRRLLLVPMTRESYRASVFLDDRIVVAGEKGAWQPIAPIEAIADKRGAASRPLNILVHTAFCGSTALATALDAPGIAFAYREPAPLHQLACVVRDLDDPGASPPPGVPPRERLLADALLVAALCTRTFDAGELPVLKPTDACTPLVTELLASMPRARAVMLYDPPEQFAVSMLKSDDRREHLRTVSHRARVDMGMTGEPGSDAHAAAIAWLGHARAYAAAHASAPGRVRALPSTALFASPADALGAVAAEFRLGLKRRTVERLAAKAFSDDAKRPGTAFDPAARAGQRRGLRARLAPEIDAMLDHLAAISGPDDPGAALPGELEIGPPA